MEFKEYLTKQDKSENTIIGYMQDLKHFSQWFKETNGEDFSPELLTATDVKLYRQHLQVVQKAKPATINRRLYMLKVYAQAACICGEIQFNPITGIKGMTVQEMAPHWLERKHQAALERILERDVMTATTEAWKRQAIRDRCIVLVLLNTGLRIGELCDLKLDDITLWERKGELRVRHGKGRKARTIPLNNTAVKALNSWLDVRPDIEADGLFTGKHGEVLDQNGVQRRIRELSMRSIQHRLKSYTERVGNGEITAHTLRHTFAKNLVDAGVTLEKVAALLGHSDINTTRIYITPGQIDLLKAVELLDL